VLNRWVRFRGEPIRVGSGSEADMTTHIRHVCFAPEKRHKYRDALGRALLPCPIIQISTCSAISRASSISIPRYLTVLSIFV
jgi:hypothetical protein